MSPPSLPPAGPDSPDVHRHSGSSFGSAGYSSCEDPFLYCGGGSGGGTGGGGGSSEDAHSDYGSAGSSGASHSPSRHSCGSLDSGSGGSASGTAVASRCRCGDAAERARLAVVRGEPPAGVLRCWLTELGLAQYAAALLAAGYDLPTLARATPEDLLAAGVNRPEHRRRLRTELAALQLPDTLPDYIPGSLPEWLRLLRLEEHAAALLAGGCRSVQLATQLAWEDLEDLGIVRLGHQKKILLAIKRVKDIRAGKRGAPALPPQCSQEAPARSACSYRRAPSPLLVPIQLTAGPRGRSLESLEDPAEYSTFSSPPPCQFPPATPPSPLPPQGGTLPRPRTRPVAKIAARRACPPPPPARVSVQVHEPPLPLPACPSSDSLSSLSLDTLLPPPPPAPPSPPALYKVCTALYHLLVIKRCCYHYNYCSQ